MSKNYKVMTLEDFYKDSEMNRRTDDNWDPDAYSQDRSCKNGSGYYDPTAYLATRDTTGSHRRFATC